MDLNDVRSIVREMRWEWEREHLDEKECPKCGRESTMIKVWVTPKNPEADFIHKWRCLNCLGMFTEGLTEVEA